MKFEHARRWNAQVGRGLTKKPFTVYDYIPKMAIACKRAHCLDLIANDTWIPLGN